MSNRKIEETASSGAVSAHSIAVRIDGENNDFLMQRRAGSFLDFMSQFNSRLKNRVNFKPVRIKKPFSKTIKENMSLDQVYSKLGSIRNQGRAEDSNVQTYGVEDDDGNLMKITVRKDQAEKFEVALAQELAEVENYKMTGRGGYGRTVSIAEVLYNLKQQFDIVNVEFPEIPANKVYNADKVSDPEDAAFSEDEFKKTDDEDFSNEEEFSDDNAEDMDLSDSSNRNRDNLDDSDIPDEEDLGVEFDEEDEKNEESKLLKDIIKMLTKQAEAQAAEAEAAAEKYRALQAEYSAMAAKEEMVKQTELARLERELEEQKSREKDAKRMADLARYRLRSVSEGGSFIGTLNSLLELDDLDSEITMRIKRREAQKIKDPIEKRFRMQSLLSDQRLVRYKNKKENEKQKEQGEQENDEKNDSGTNNLNTSGPSTIYNQGGRK